MLASPEIQTIRGRMSIIKIIFTVVLIAGTILLTVSSVFGFTTAAYIWLLALLVGGLFMFKAEYFLTNPKSDKIKSLSQMTYSFVVIWIVAAIVSIVGIMEGEEIVGVLLALIATLMMYQFRRDAKSLISLQHQSMPDITPPQILTMSKFNVCSNCGTQDSGNFCPNCGTKLLN